MSRLETKCPEDCATCPLLAEGKVDMIPCLLDQMATRQRRIERKMTALEGWLQELRGAAGGAPLLAGSADAEQEEGD